MDFYSFIYPFSEDDLTELAYFFQDENMSSYAVNAARWSGPLNASVSQWRDEWKGTGPQPRLELQRGADGTHKIYDSRRGQSKTYDVDEEMVRILHRLFSPIRCDRFASEFGLTPEVASDKLSFLRANELVFEEGDRLMSLVITEAKQDSLSDAATSTDTTSHEMDIPVGATQLPITEILGPR
jgi:hypothetical protein